MVVLAQLKRVITGSRFRRDHASTDQRLCFLLEKINRMNGTSIYPKERVLFLYKDFPDIEKGDGVTVQKRSLSGHQPQDEDVSHKDVVVSDYFYQFGGWFLCPRQP